MKKKLQNSACVWENNKVILRGKKCSKTSILFSFALIIVIENIGGEINDKITHTKILY